MSENKPQEEVSRPFGRPSKYTDDVPNKLITFFTEIKPLILGDTEVGFIFPTIEKFCANIGIVTSTFYKWCDEKPDLSSAFNMAKQMQKDTLIQLGANGIYKEGFAKFMAINCTDMRDKIEHNIDRATISINIDESDKEL